MVRFDTVYMAPRVRVALGSILEPAYVRKFWELVDKLRGGRFDIRGLNVEKLHTRRGKVYSARLNKELRVIFSMFARGEKRSLVLWDANHHDAAYDRVERTVLPFMLQGEGGDLETVQSWGAGTGRSLSELDAEAQDIDSEELTDGLLLFAVPHYVLAEPGKYGAFEKNIDRYLRLTDEQEDLIRRYDRAYLVQGSAGTGKTTLALFHALDLFERSPDDDIFFFTYQDELACVCRCYKVNLVGEEESESDSGGGLRVFSYLEFCRHYLRSNLESKPVSWQFVDRPESIRLIEEIIASKSRWSRSIQAEDTYSYIYSILKGRFVPGEDRFPESDDDYRRIFKGYGSVPKNLDEILEIYRMYEMRLARGNLKDEADLIRYCYQGLKNTALLSGDKRATWIVIDEIQDFTELEWKSILLFWENKCKVAGAPLSFPFLSGDRNQNISRSGFRWQDVDSYVDGILRDLHRPNALTKVQLHKNFRNTLEIFNLGKFIRQRAPEGGGEPGLPPNFSGRKPLVVVGDKADFVRFLAEVGTGSQQELPAPLVVLFEDEQDLKSLRRGLPIDDGLFLMPLRRSKGMEFEDCILYRLFSSISGLDEDSGPDLTARLFDLWYMGVTRGRKNLLIYLTPEDWQLVRSFFAADLPCLLDLVDLHESDPLPALKEFHEGGEKYVPNYNVIFLERVKAQEAWDEAGQDSVSEEEGLALREQALRLWKKCRDWSSLGLHLKEMGRFHEAISYLRLANLPNHVAFCFESLGDLISAGQYYEEDHDLRKAADCYRRGGNHGRAAEIFEILQSWMDAGRCWADAGESKRAATCFEHAQEWEEAANFFSLRGEWLKAADLYKKCERFESAAEMYLKVKDKLDAARCYTMAGLHLKAAKLLESLNRWAEAAECYDRAGAPEKAGPLYAKAGRLKEVAACAEKVGDWALAAPTYERMRNWSKAAHGYLLLGMKAKAVACMENGGDWEKALPLLIESGEWLRVARACEKTGRIEEAIEHYLQEGAYAEAGHCYEKLEQWNQAADCYLKGQNFLSAAQMLARVGRRVDAARLCLLAGQIGPAMEFARGVLPGDPSAEKRHGDLRLDLALWAEQKGKLEAAAAIYESLGQFMLAAHRYKQSCNPLKAAACFEKDRKFALAAELYLEGGEHTRAAECYQSLNQWQKAAACFELCQQWARAKELYERCGDEEGARRCQSSARWL